MVVSTSLISLSVLVFRWRLIASAFFGRVADWIITRLSSKPSRGYYLRTHTDYRDSVLSCCFRYRLRRCLADNVSPILQRESSGLHTRPEDTRCIVARHSMRSVPEVDTGRARERYFFVTFIKMLRFLTVLWGTKNVEVFNNIRNGKATFVVQTLSAQEHASPRKNRLWSCMFNKRVYVGFKPRPEFGIRRTFFFLNIGQ